MDILVALYGWLSQYIHPFSAIIALAAVFVLYKYWLKPFTALVSKTTLDLEKVSKTLADEKGNPIISFSLLADIKEQLALLRDDFEEHESKADSHYSDLQHVTSAEHWKTCDINKCVHMQQIFNKFDKATERFDAFDKRVEETRANTNLSLQDIREGQKDLGKELGDLAKLIINVLADNLKAR